MRRGPLAVAVAGTAVSMASLAVYRGIVRPWYVGWGVEPYDEDRLLPGDELIAAPTAGDTRGIAIDAPAAAIWPWLVQMGFGRAGWYSYDALDMRGRSAEAIVPDWQALAVGDTLPTWPGGGFEVVQIEPDRALVLYLDDRIVTRQAETARETAVGGVGAEPATTPGLAASAAILRTQPREFRASWSFVLDPVAGERTRLIERFRVEYPATGRWNRLTGPAVAVGVFLMTRRQMLGIRQRAERLIARGPTVPVAGGLPAPTGHQELVPV